MGIYLIILVVCFLLNLVNEYCLSLANLLAKFFIMVDVEMNASSSSVYMVESFDSWHYGHGHVNVKSIKLMHSMHLIPKLAMSEMQRCQVCVEVG